MPSILSMTSFLAASTTSQVINSTSLVNQSSQQGKILVVDNSASSRMAATAFLAADGYQILEADNGVAAMQQAVTNNPDLILLDAMMPQIDGFEICRRLKQDQTTSLIPVVVVTVDHDRQSRVQSIEAGADDFLLKPLDYLELSARVKSLVRQKRLNESLNQTQQLLFSIAKAVEQRDCASENPKETIAALATAFSRYLGLTEEEIQDLVWATHLHDIGTVGIPDAIMLKKGPLTPQERQLVKQHVLIGEQICQPLRYRRRVLEIIRHHHERWDGSGYPDGITGEEIPKLAQIFQIVDIYDALTRERGYKKALSTQQALETLQEEADRGWRNPQLVQQFADFITQK